MRMAVHTVVLILLLSVMCPPSWAATREVSFTQQDRDRLIRLEVRLDEGLKRLEEGLKNTNQRMEEGSKSTNQRMEEGLKNTNQRMEEGFKSLSQRMEEGFRSTNQRINDLYGLLNVLIYVMLCGMIAMVGFVLWDRRTTLAPVVRKIKEIEARSEKTENALKELALRDPNAAEANKRVGLL
ncbi:hypothetical protein [Candidatus Magnetominusculus dajiuhuensis]|uniref:hypothetical protein n=1 Tax=Candidatus Magnetominusculus dajiuhuensis TaxID=3137712 RepID=UPI003B432B8C